MNPHTPVPPHSQTQIDVLHRDAQLLVVNKPPGVLSQKDRTGDPDLVALGKALLVEKEGPGGDAFLAPAHRLDRPASGVLALARTSEAARALTEQFRERLVDKRYLAVVEGEGAGHGTLTGYVAKVDATPRLTGPEDAAARYAELTYQTLAEKDGLSLLLVRPQTGRPHQIRLQLSAQGFPVLGDFRYGAEQPLDGQNLALHSYFLAFEHPGTARRAAFRAGPPGSWPRCFGKDIDRLLGR